MAQQARGELLVDDRGAVLVATLDGGPHSLFGVQIADQLDALVKAGRKTIPTCARWCSPVRVTDGSSATLTSGGLQAEGAAVPGTPRLRGLGRAADGPRRRPRPRTGSLGAEDGDARCRPTRSSAQHLPADERQRVVFVAALNGSALGWAPEFAWACDLRIMADDDSYFIGQPEILLGIMPGGGGSQRLPG